MNSKDIKNKLRSGEQSIGGWLQLGSANVAEIMGKAGFDWIAVDLEHGPIPEDKLCDVIRAIELGGTVPLVRVAENTSDNIKKALDAGAMGIISPMIESGEDVQNMISWSMYPPQGTRGVGYSRANLFGRNFIGYNKKINQELILVPQVEHIRGVENIEKILKFEEIDAVIIGPYDLSASMGMTGEFENPKFIEAVQTVHLAAKKMNKPMGIHVVDPDSSILDKKIEEGYRFLAYATDAIFLWSACNRQKNDKPR